MAFLAGIWLASTEQVPLAAALAVGLLGGVIGLLARRQWVAVCGYGLAAATLGALLHAAQALPRPDDIARVIRPDERAAIAGYVESELPTEEGRRRRFVLRVRRLESREYSGQADGRVLLDVRGATGRLDGSPVRCEGTVRRPRPAGNPGQFDLAEVLHRRHVRVILEASGVPRADDLRLPLLHRVRGAAAGVRALFVERLQACMPGPCPDLYVEMLAAIVYGLEAMPVPADWAEAARQAGTIHLLVVSGSQLTLIAGIVLGLFGIRRWAVWHWIGRRLSGRPTEPSRVVRRVEWWQAILAVAALVFFALMVGTGPSVSRALIMAGLALTAGVIGLDYDPYTALGLAAAAICAADPLALFSVGMQLSFGATLGVLVALRSLSSTLEERSPPFRFLAGVAAGSAGAWLIVTPLLAYHFHAFPLLGSLANLVAVPASAVAMVLTQLAIPLSFIHETAGAVPLYPARWMVDAIVRANDVCCRLPGAYVEATHFPGWTCVLWYAVLAGLACAYRARLNPRRLTPRQWLGGALAAGVMAAVWFAVSSHGPERLTVTFLDVGHGQCCLIEAGGGRTVMVDAGSGYTLSAGQRCARNAILPFLRTRGIERLDAIIITHPDADHLNAVPAIVSALDVGVVLESFPDEASPVYAAVRAAAEAAGVPLKRAAAGGAIALGREARAEVLWPTGTRSDATFDDNDRSLVLRLRHREVFMLLPADIGLAAENELMRRGAPLGADVLQVPHHGSAGSSSRAFLRAVSPSVAVVSCQTADPAHPAPVVEARLRGAGAQVWRTDRSGAVSVVSDGRRVVVESHARRRAHRRLSDWARAWSSASNNRSGSVSARAAASSVSLGPRAVDMR